MTYRLLLLQGPNLRHLGRRQPELYGRTTAAELDAMLLAQAGARGASLDIVYSDHEGEAIERLWAAREAGIDGLLFNPGAWLYAGYPLRDCLRAMTFPMVEVHMTSLDRRGQKSITAEAATGLVSGFGIHSYLLGLDALLRLLADRPANG